MSEANARTTRMDDTEEYYRRATREMSLTPQEQYLYQHHLNNLYGSGKVLQGRDVSTVLQMVADGPDGRYYNIPLVWDGKVLSEDDAKAKAAEIGWDKWPGYQTIEGAEGRYGLMHNYMDRDVSVWRNLRRSPGVSAR